MDINNNENNNEYNNKNSAETNSVNYSQADSVGDFQNQDPGMGYQNYQNPNNQNNQGYQNYYNYPNNQNSQGYQNFPNNQNGQGYQNYQNIPNNQNSQGYQNYYNYPSNQNNQGYQNYQENPYVQQAVYPTMATVPPANISAEKRSFNLIMIKLAIFAMIMVLNSNFLYVIFSIPAIDILQAMGESATTEVIYFVSWFVNDLSAYLIPGLSAFLLFRKELGEKLAYPPHPGASPVLNSGLTFFAACFLGSMAGLLANAIAALMDSLFGTGEIPDVIGSTVPPQGELGSFGIMFFFVAVTAPIFEELIFRKLLLVPLRRYSDWFAIIVTALIFGFYHGNFDQMPYAFVVGMFFALLAVNTNSVIPSMILHVANNTLVTLSQYLTQVTGEVEPAVSISNLVSEGLTLSFWLGIPAVALMIAGKLFKTTHKSVLAPRDKAGLIFKNPAFYVFAVFMILMMVDIGDIIELFAAN